MNKLSIFSVIAAITASSFFFAFSQGRIARTFSEKDKTFPMLEPGDEIVDMVITTGIEDAFPLWSICAPKKVDDHSIGLWRTGAGA